MGTVGFSKLNSLHYSENPASAEFYRCIPNFIQIVSYTTAFILLDKLRNVVIATSCGYYCTLQLGRKQVGNMQRQQLAGKFVTQVASQISKICYFLFYSVLYILAALLVLCYTAICICFYCFNNCCKLSLPSQRS